MGKSITHNLAIYDEKKSNESRELNASFYIHFLILKHDGVYNEYISQSAIFKKLKRLREDDNLKNIIQQEKSITLDNVAFKCSSARVNLTIWSEQLYGKEPVVKHNYTVDDAQSEIHLTFTKGHYHLILDKNKFEKKYSNSNVSTLFEIVASLEGNVDTVDTLKQRWFERTGSYDVSLLQEALFHQEFGVGWDIWYGSISTNQKRQNYKHMHMSIFPESCLKLERIRITETPGVISVNELFIQRNENELVFNSCKRCGYITRDKWLYKRHEKGCSGETRIICKQKSLKTTHGRQLLLKYGFIDESIHLTDFLALDVESIMEAKNERVRKKKCLSFNTHKVATIALTKSWDVTQDGTVKLTRNKMDLEGYFEFVFEIMEKIEDLRQEYVNRTPEKIKKARKIISERLDESSDASEAKKNRIKYNLKANDSTKDHLILPVWQKTEYQQMLKYLKEYDILNVYSWNGKSYDHRLLYGGIVTYCKQLTEELRKINPEARPYWVTCIKKGTKIASINTPNLNFRDAMAYTSPCKLDQFGKVYQATVSKHAFCYEKYSSLDELRDDYSFPPIQDFKSSLNLRVESINRQTFEQEINQIEEDISSEQLVKIFSTDECLLKSSNFSKMENGKWEVIGIETYKSPMDLSKYIISLNHFNMEKKLDSSYNMLSYFLFYNAIGLLRYNY